MTIARVAALALLLMGCAAPQQPGPVEAPRAAAPELSGCAQRDAAAAALAEQYGEAVVARGWDGDVMLEVFASPDGSTWTIMSTTPDCVSAMHAAGTDWQALNREPEGTSL